MFYVALLRGINVGGHKIIKMEALRQSLTALGLSDVATYVQSGNVVFQAIKTTPAALEREVKKNILKDFGHEVPVLVKSAPALTAVIKANPFLKDPKVDPLKLHVTFLALPPEGAKLKALASLSSKGDFYKIVGQEIYLRCRQGYSDSPYSNNTIEKLFGIQATTRNWSTVSKLFAMTQIGGVKKS